MINKEQNRIIVKCRSIGCNKDIMFIPVKNKQGELKTHPVNAKPLKVFVNINGEWLLTKGYESHFTNCIAADKWRKK